jgi:RNA polymerase sigma factor (sigma-70 family)
VIYQQFGPLVKGWVLRHPAFPHTGEGADHFVNLAFMRLWGALTPEKCDEFDDTRSILRYLQTCTHSAIIDYLRSRRKELLDIDSMDVQYQIEKKREIISQQIHHAIYCRQVLEAARERLKTTQERLVFHEAYVLGMKPQDIYQQHPDEFHNVREIYRIKENILARLRRDKELQQMLA